MKGKTSFLNSWSALSNSDLLEESCVRAQIPEKLSSRSVKPPLSTQLPQQSIVLLPGSNTQFLRGTSSPSRPSSKPLESDEESMISASSEELDFDEIEEFQKEIVDDESFIEEICNLFRPNDKEVNSVEEADVFSPIQIKDIPQHLRAIIED